MTKQEAKAVIPGELLQRIEDLEDVVIDDCIKRKIAVFDLDNTLLIGDIGDAVFAQLLLDGRSMPFSWEEYDGLIRAGKKREAYVRVVTAMAGLTLEELIDTTRRVMGSGLSHLKLPETEVPVPMPNPAMLSMLSYLRFLDYDTYVISATNVHSVRFVTREYFGFPDNHAFGIKPVLHHSEGSDAVLGDEVEEPVTVFEGKAEVYRQNIGDTAPLISAGDSFTDVPMLNLTDHRGIVIWARMDKSQHEAVTKKMRHPESIFYLYP